MRNNCSIALLCLVMASAVLFGQAATRTQSAAKAGLAVSSEPEAATQGRVLADYGKLPLSFEANQGQVAQPVRFLSRGLGYTLFLTSDETVLTLRKASRADGLRSSRQDDAGEQTADVLRMKLVGANSSPSVSGLDEQEGRSNYFLGNDPKRWRTNVANYRQVRYANVYPGVDLVYYGRQQQLEYDFVLAPGTDPGTIQWQIRADVQRDVHRLLRIARNGDLVVTTAAGEVRFRKPLVYQPGEDFERTQAIGGLNPVAVRHSVDARWILKGNAQVAFEVAAYDTKKPLVIDPALNYSTYVGGSAFNAVYGIALDSSGSAYVTGGVTSTDYPVTPGVVQPKYAGNHDLFVTKLNATGTGLVYSTYLGGSGIDHGSGIAVDASGNAYAAGTTSSTDYPVTPGAFQTTCKGCGGTNPDAFISKLNPTGTALVYSTYLGGSGYEHVAAMTIDKSGDAYVTGFTCSTDYPTTPGALQTVYKGSCTLFGGNVLVTEMNPTGSELVYSTYLGGTGTDCANAITVDPAGNTYVAGYTSSTDFPTTPGAFQTHNAGKNDAFVAKLNSNGSALGYSTYIGSIEDDLAWGVKVDTTGSAYVVGQTLSPNFPTTTGAFQTVCGSCTLASPQTDGFVTKLDPTASSLVYSTFLGGKGEDTSFAVALGVAGDVYVVGETGSTDFKTTPGALETVNAGGVDAYVVRLNAKGTAELYSTFFGSNPTTILGIAVNNTNHTFVVGGRTYSTTFATTPGAFQTSCSTCNLQKKFADGFVAKFINGDQIWPLALNFGNQTVGTSSGVTNTVLSNSSSTILHVSAVQISGANSSDFSATNTCSSPVLVGASCSVGVRFKPSALGAESATLTVTDDAANSPQKVILEGTGTVVEFAPASLSFAKQTVGTTSAPKQTTLTNKGTVALSLSSIGLAGVNSGDFAQTHTCGTSLAPGANCSISVTFTPTARGIRSAAVSVSDNGGGSPQQVPLTGLGN